MTDNSEITETTPDEEDFRVRSARRKRERMQARLFEAILQVCAEKGRLPTVIDEVVQAASVARGTFYKYYASLDDLVEAVGTRLADEVTTEAIALMPGMPYGPLGTAAGIRLLLAKAAADRVWGTFAVRSNFLSADTVVGKRARHNLAVGHADGHYVFAHTDTATDFVLGSVTEGIKRLLTGGVDVEFYIYQLTLHVLQGLGLPHAMARSAAEEVYGYFQQHGAARIPWWPETVEQVPRKLGSPPDPSLTTVGDVGADGAHRRGSTKTSAKSDGTPARSRKQLQQSAAPRRHRSKRHRATRERSAAPPE